MIVEEMVKCPTCGKIASGPTLVAMIVALRDHERTHTATERYCVEQERRLREGTASIAEMNPRWSPGPAVEDPTADCADAIRHIAKNVVIDSKPPVSREEMKRRYVQVVGTIGGPGEPPSFEGIPVAKSAEAIQREKDERLEQMRAFCAPVPLVVSLEPGAINRVGPQRWYCETCKTGNLCGPGESPFDARDAHDATPQHDRNTEKRLRSDVEDARAAVECARETLYDYLKGKGRVA